MSKVLTRSIVILYLIANACVYAEDACRMPVYEHEKNYIIGYGSLMQEESRRLTHPNAKYVYPIEVKGFKRVWGIHGNNYKTTFLTLIKDKTSSVNAVYYPAADYEVLEADEREVGYCRTLVSKDQIRSLGLANIPDGKYWLYTQRDNKIDLPNKEYPVVQSYVDIFLDGCIQIGEIYQLPEFLEKCIHETHGWPKEYGTWVNDRQFPRRPFGIPNALKIDKILSAKFENYYHHPID